MIKKNILTSIALAIFATCFNGAICHAQNIEINKTNSKNGFSALAKKLLPSVVGVRAENAQSNNQMATGSGFIFDNQGHIITNNHVVELGTKFQISLQNGEFIQAKLIGRDEETDIAVLQIANKNLPFIDFANSDNVEIGDLAIAIGSPFGLGNSFSAGVISGRNRDLQSGRFDNFLQTDAAINSGNSGGPLFNEYGQIIGVNTAIVSDAQNGGSLGIGFAIPSNIVKRIAFDIVKYGYVRRGYAGFRARISNPNEGAGVIITAVAKNHPAYKSGLRAGDRIFAINNQPIKDPRFLARMISDSAIGAKVRLDGFRANQRIYANLIITLAPSIQAIAPTGEQKNVSVLGIKLRVLSQAEKAKYGEDSQIIIYGIDPMGPNQSALNIGDILLEVQGQKVTTPAQAQAQIAKAKRRYGIVLIKIRRDGNSYLRSIR